MAGPYRFGNKVPGMDALASMLPDDPSGRRAVGYVTLLPPALRELVRAGFESWHSTPPAGRRDAIARAVIGRSSEIFADTDVASVTTMWMVDLMSRMTRREHLISAPSEPTPVVRVLRAAVSPVRPDWSIDEPEGSDVAADDLNRILGSVAMTFDPEYRRLRELGVRGYGSSAEGRSDAPVWGGHEVTQSRIGRLEAITDAGGRWPARRSPTQPRMAGDAVALLARYGADAFGRHWQTVFEQVDIPGVDRGPHGDVGYWQTLEPFYAEMSGAFAAAEPFFVPHGFAAAIADSSPVDADDLDEIRLPYPVCFVAFADPLVVGERVGHPDVDDIERLVPLLDDDSDLVDRVMGSPPVSIARALVANSGLVDGIVLYADDDGRLRDSFLWCLTIPTRDGSRTLTRVTLPAARSTCEFSTLVENTAALVSWGDWRDPGEFDLPEDPASREFRKALNKGAFRRAERSGAPGHVRVLDIERTASRSGSSSPTGRTVAPHLRRGHWRRSRIGPRDDWEHHRTYRRNWISPSWVNAYLGENPEPRVYRVKPHPEG